MTDTSEEEPLAQALALPCVTSHRSKKKLLYPVYWELFAGLRRLFDATEWCTRSS